jgi:hypothetical protein
MEKLTLRRRASGIHAVHGAEGEPLGVIDLGDLDLDDDELSALMQKHAQKRAAQGAADEFVRRINEHMKKTGARYREAASEVARQAPLLASEYRARVLSDRA